MVKIHGDGYRSVHYIIKTSPFKKECRAEIQVRTIFEEGWSEIDHRVRYPNFSSNELIRLFLANFNRLAGSADEMGSYVRHLAIALNNYEQQILIAEEERDKHAREIENLLNELSRAKQTGAEQDDKIAKLRLEINKALANSSISKTIAESLANVNYLHASEISKATQLLANIKHPYTSELSKAAQLFANIKSPNISEISRAAKLLAEYKAIADTIKTIPKPVDVALRGLSESDWNE